MRVAWGYACYQYVVGLRVSSVCVGLWMNWIRSGWGAGVAVDVYWYLAGCAGSAGRQADGRMDGWVGGGLVMGWRTWYSVMFAFVGFHCFWGSGGQVWGGGISARSMVSLLECRNADSSLTLSYLRASPLCIDMLQGMPIDIALRPDVSPSTCLGENLSKSTNCNGAAI